MMSDAMTYLYFVIHALESWTWHHALSKIHLTVCCGWLLSQIIDQLSNAFPPPPKAVECIDLNGDSTEAWILLDEHFSRKKRLRVNLIRFDLLVKHLGGIKGEDKNNWENILIDFCHHFVRWVLRPLEDWFSFTVEWIRRLPHQRCELRVSVWLN